MKSNKNLFYLLIIYYVSTILLQSCSNMRPNDIAKTNSLNNVELYMAGIGSTNDNILATYIEDENIKTYVPNF